MAAWSALAVAALLVPAMPAPDPRAPTGSAADADLPLVCGNFSPLPPSCSACCNIWRNYAQLSTDLLLFTGDLEVTITGQSSRNRLAWECWAILVPQANNMPLLSGCVTVATGTPPPVPGELVGLRCVTTSTGGPGLPVKVGPLGPFECTVDTDPS